MKTCLACDLGAHEFCLCEPKCNCECQSDSESVPVFTGGYE